MSEELLIKILFALLNIILLVIATYVLPAAKRYLERIHEVAKGKLTAQEYELLHKIAVSVVLAVEQTVKDLSSDGKYEKALGLAQDMAARLHIQFSDQGWKVVLEEVVRLMNSGLLTPQPPSPPQ